MNKFQLQTAYQNALELYGVYSPCWDMCYLKFSELIFCPENRKSIISQYLFWEEFTKELNEHGIVYYYGIDTFLEKYKKAVYSCLTNLEEV